MPGKGPLRAPLTNDQGSGISCGGLNLFSPTSVALKIRCPLGLLDEDVMHELIGRARLRHHLDVRPQMEPHLFSVVNYQYVATVQAACSCLQWSHALSAWRTSDVASVKPIIAQLPSMEPRVFSVVNGQNGLRHLIIVELQLSHAFSAWWTCQLA